MRANPRCEQHECVSCGTLTRFERSTCGPRGGNRRYEPCCPTCGELGLPAAPLAKAAA